MTWVSDLKLSALEWWLLRGHISGIACDALGWENIPMGMREPKVANWRVMSSNVMFLKVLSCLGASSARILSFGHFQCSSSPALREGGQDVCK